MPWDALLPKNSLQNTLPRAFYLRETVLVARSLLGCLLVRRMGERLLAGRISETEAYCQEDPASHSFRGETLRNAAMFGAPGNAYVYLCYGVHHCVNAVTEAEGVGAAVLIRAVEPLMGIERMIAHRKLPPPDCLEENEDRRSRQWAAFGRALCGGPGKVCQAFGIQRELDGADLVASQSLWICPPHETLAAPQKTEICATPRIGISKATEQLWRFHWEGELFLSRSVAPNRAE